MSAQGVAGRHRSMPQAAAARVRPAGPVALWRRRRPTPPRVLATLTRLLLFAGLCVTGSALLALLGAGSASAAPATPGKPAAHSDGTAHTAGILDGVGHLTKSVLDPASGPARAADHRPAATRHHAGSGDAAEGADAGVVPSLVHAVLTGHGPDAHATEPAASRPRPRSRGGSGDGIGETAVSGVTAADRAVASVARTIEPVTATVDQAVAPVRPVTAALTAPLAPVVGEVVTPLQPITRPAGHLLTATGLVPVHGASSHPGPGNAAHHQHDATAVAVTFPSPGLRMFGAAAAAPITAAGIGGAGVAPGAKAARDGDVPADQPAPLWPLGVTLPAAGTTSSNSMSSGAGGNVAAGHAERVGATPWPRVIGITSSSDDIARQLDAGKPQVSPD